MKMSKVRVIGFPENLIIISITPRNYTLPALKGPKLLAMDFNPWRPQKRIVGSKNFHDWKFRQKNPSNNTIYHPL